LPETLTVREVRVRVQQQGFRTRSLVVATPLLEPEAAPRKELALLYRLRWYADISHPHYPSSDNLYRERQAA
jgi:hypothetical protein